MDLSNYDEMDPGMFFSLVNTKLRNDKSNLHDLALSLDIDEQAFLEHMHAMGFRHVADIRQFR
ncbi:MAG: DUF4250 family protein [Chromatiales bacterium]|jgi:hypothetical protein